MKYVDTLVVFREVPNEITLAINVSNCPVKCPDCHSSYLTQDVGDVLDTSSLAELIAKNPGISCVSFMGGDAEPMLVRDYSLWIKQNYPDMKVCWYSGRDIKNAEPVLDALDFVKVGPYIDKYGPLDKETTNQRFYKVDHEEGKPILTDWTRKFQEKSFV